VKLSVNWLKRYVKTGLDPRGIAEALTRVGLEVEAVTPVGDDSVLDAEVTSNRPDWLSVIGVARELAATTGTTFEVPEVRLDESSTPVDELAAVEIIDADLCPRYTARVITGVKVGPSPGWLATLLEAIGLRPVNNVVDVTNFVMYECGQPLHAFDCDTLAGRRIVVRRSKKGEMITAIDASRHELSGAELMICDAARPVAIGGVMGGLDTEVSGSTRTVLLESARFAPMSIRDTAARLSMESDASFRFSRGVDRERVEWASRRCAAMIAEVCGGKVARGIVDANYDQVERREVGLRVSRVPVVLGIEIPRDECRRILEALGLETVRAGGDDLVMRVPGWRSDLDREIDLIEEVARVHGYEKIPPSPSVPLVMARKDDLQHKVRLAAEVLTAAGFDECVTFSFDRRESARLVNVWTDADPLEVENPVDAEQGSLRTSLLPSLLGARQLNQARRNEDVRLFEIAHVYLPDPNGKLPEERLVLGLVGDVDFRTMKGVVQTLLERFGIGDDVRQEEAALRFLAAGVTLHRGDRLLGCLGDVADDLRGRYKLKGRVTAAELDFGAIVRDAKLDRRYAELPRYPQIRRDLALLVDESVRWADVERTLGSDVPEILESLDFLSEFHGRQIPAGKKSLALSMSFRASDRTLTHDEADAAQARILKRLEEDLGATLRMS
jgi:phenylalanyl-tRNA synthetase beta chain